MENIYLEMYCLLIDIYIRDFGEKEKVFNVIEIFFCVKKKVQWVFKWMNKSFIVIFGERIIVFVVVEGIFFFGVFVFIFWFKKRGLMFGLMFFNELIFRDEGFYCDFVCLIFLYLRQKLSREWVSEIVCDVVVIEKEFWIGVLFCYLLGMNCYFMVEYIEFVVDRLLVVLGFEKYYKMNNFFFFMENIFLEGKFNFYERRVLEY